MDSLHLAIKILIPVLVLLLCYSKRTGNLIKSMDTFFHESFHALTALVLGNKVKEISIEPNTEGFCKSLSKSRFKIVLTALSGYLFCSFLPPALLYAIANSRVEITFLLLFIFAILMLILYMRNTYALVWTVSFAALNLICYLVPLSKSVAVSILYCYICISAIGNTTACLGVLKLSIVSPKQSGDCALLAKTTKIPAILWAVLFNGVNIWLLYHTAMAIFVVKTV